MDEAVRLATAYRDKLLSANTRVERLESQLGEALAELTAMRSLIRDLHRESNSLEKRLNIAQKNASWYRSKLLKFVTTKWIKQEKAKDGF